MKCVCIAFTEQGWKLSQRLSCSLEGWEMKCSRGFGAEKVALKHWTTAAFQEADALLFIGAAGIAVRAIAPHVQSKMKDPAVLVVDEEGRFVISLLSGHMGGANRLARQLAAVSGGQAVLTTATDVRDLWAVDEWAVQQHFVICNPEKIKDVSAALLRGEIIHIYSDLPIAGKPPRLISLTEKKAAAQVIVSPFSLEPDECSALQLVPPVISVGIGCRKGSRRQDIERTFQSALQEAQIRREAIRTVSSIDLKKSEAGLLLFCEENEWPLLTYSAEELSHVRGSQARSDFVERITGVDNVCERSALKNGGHLVLPKYARSGVTIAFAMQEIPCSFEM